MNDTRPTTPKPEDEAKAQAPANQPEAQAWHEIQFPEDQIPGAGFMQYSKKSGWFWIGIKLPNFNFRTAWAFIKSAEYQVSTAMDEIEQARLSGLKIMNTGKGKPNGAMENLLRTIRGGK